MRVHVKLFAQLRKYLPPGSDGHTAVLDLPDGATVGDLIARLGVPPGHARMIVSGDQHLDLESGLRDGQEVNVFPPLAGGG